MSSPTSSPIKTNNNISSNVTTPPPHYNTIKAEEIRKALSEPTINLWKLRDLAISDGGLVNGTLRR